MTRYYELVWEHQATGEVRREFKMSRKQVNGRLRHLRRLGVAKNVQTYQIEHGGLVADWMAALNGKPASRQAIGDQET